MTKRESPTATILLVDDEEGDLDLARNALRGAGYKVVCASSYAEAMGMFEAHRDKLDLIVADVSLPDGNGCELALALWKQAPGLRPLFVSGHVGAEVCRFYGLDVADSHFLSKPYTPEALVERVRQVLDAREPFPKLYAQKAMGSADGPTG
jgi:DNA-binding response OmpR family regulator